MKKSILLATLIYVPLAAPPTSFMHECANTALKTSITLAVGSAFACASYAISKAIDHYFERKKNNHSEKIIYSTLSFHDLAGTIPAPLLTAVDMIKNPTPYQRLNISLPRGILLFGPPGTGKTLLARALAGELQCPFLYQSGSQFIHLWAGLGAHNIRTLFAQARAAADKHPQKTALIFIDELDAIGSKRIVGSDGAGAERNQALNQLLIEMDGINPKNSSVHIIVVGATNMLSLLDQALLRPGRFDEIVEVSLPNNHERAALITFYLNKHPHDRTLDIQSIADATDHFSAADIRSLIHKAALHAARTHRELVGHNDIMQALRLLHKP